MPELRQNISTKEWVIIAAERARRPEEFSTPAKPAPQLPPYDPHCPFCAGNESQTPPAVLTIPQDSTWEIRVTPNKYAALVPRGDVCHHTASIKHWMNGFGIHEVIIETPHHDAQPALMPRDHIADIIRAYRHRFLAAYLDDRIELVTIFKNHGESAGTSLVHPHSQLIATPIVPMHIRHRVEEAMHYFDEHGECVFCTMLRDEIRLHERLIEETEYFAAFVLYAASSPFHTWIVPKAHRASFGEITDAQIADLALILKNVLARLYFGLNNPDYNYIIRSIPGPVRRNEYYHWYLSIVPRIVKTAGFELGSGIYINTALPETSAEFLRNVDISHATTGL
jgi:UDPglucose--hexose-1-phosphate uridylyltransferase